MDLLLVPLLLAATALAVWWLVRRRRIDRQRPDPTVTYTCTLCGERDCQCTAHRGGPSHE